MSSKSPIFPIPEPQHFSFSDYGFDKNMGYFQVLEEARRHKRESRSIDALHFKLQKPISKEESKKSKKRKWWRNALLFWKCKREEEAPLPPRRRTIQSSYRSAFGPLYGWEVGHSTRCRMSRPSSCPLAGSLTATRRGDIEIPYLSLSDLNLDSERPISTSSLPIYLVT